MTCRDKGRVSLVDSKIDKNGGCGLRLYGGCHAQVFRCNFSGNFGGIIQKEAGCTTSCSYNTAHVPVAPPKTIPGFRITAGSSGKSEAKPAGPSV